MPFVRNDLLQNLVNEITALRRQVTDQRHALERIQDATNKAVTEHLNETRDTIRRALNDTRDTLTGPLTDIHAQLSGLANLLQHPSEAGEPAISEPPTPTAPRDQDTYEDHVGLLLAAAAIGSATLACHRDTWAFLVEQAGRHRQFHLPGEVKDAKNGRAEVDLSGSSLVAILITLRESSIGHRSNGNNPDPAIWALSTSLYNRIRAVVRYVGQSIQADPQQLRDVTITIDDKSGPPREATQAEDAGEPSPDTDDNIGD